MYAVEAGARLEDGIVHADWKKVSGRVKGQTSETWKWLGWSGLHGGEPDL